MTAAVARREHRAAVDFRSRLVQMLHVQNAGYVRWGPFVFCARAQRRSGRAVHASHTPTYTPMHARTHARTHARMHAHTPSLPTRPRVATQRRARECRFAFSH